jgi:hypothetical protein
MSRFYLTSLIAIGTTVLAQDSVRVVAPDRPIVLPLPEGAVRTLAVEVEGKPPRSVWLATRAGATARVCLRDAGKGRFEVDLDDPAVAAVLRLEGVEGRLQVFAEAADGRVLATGPVDYALHCGPTEWHALVWSGDHRTRVRAGQRRPAWFQPERVLKVEVEGPQEQDAPRVFAQCGDREWPLARGKPRTTWVLEMPTPVRDAWSSAGAITFRVEGEREQHAQIVVRAKPSRLCFEGASAQVTVVQRKSAPLPGSNDYLVLAIDDITHGQVLVEVVGADGEPVAGKRSVRQGEAIPLLVGDEVYTLVLDRLVNMLIGDDFAAFTLSAGAPSWRRQIDALLSRIEGGPAVFVREGKRYGGADAAAHLRSKLAAAREEVTSVEDFITKVASRSSSTGAPYLVETPGGKAEPAESWLRRAAADLAPAATSRPTSR